LLLAEWDLTLVALAGALIVCRPRLQRWAGGLFRVALIATVTAQLYLYTLNAVSNASWGRNINAHLVSAFAPTIWSGTEPFPVGPRGITALALGIVLIVGLMVWAATRRIDRSFAAWFDDSSAAPGWRWRSSVVTTAVILFAVTGATLRSGVANRDDLFWKDELIASFFRPVGFAFEPTERRAAAAARDDVLRASYPHPVPGARRKNVVLIIVDSLRADRMQVYGYSRPTTPFLSQLVQGGSLKKVGAAFSTCSESLCGITSTLASREFPDISARTYDLQDVLRDEGYQTWFLLSGNHTAWNGLPQFYRASDGTLFDGSQTVRYSMDDDRLVLEGLERVPPASPATPAFFYVHLMSTHYLGVQFADSHVFTQPDDRVSPGLEPYKILEKLNKPDRYDDKVRQADGIIRDVFSSLAAKRYLDDAVVVITGDHGEGLGERHWAHGWDLHNEDIRIPLLIYDQPAASYPDLTFGTQVDIAPTILDRLGLPIPESWDGESLRAPSATRFTYHQTYFIPNRFAVLYRDRERLFKFIATPQYGQEELYDLRRDAGEVRNLVAEDPELAALLRDKVRRYRAP
jgi:glucan phosphoethanolaminetransferase (alkaline phosphatase superfamily)